MTISIESAERWGKLGLFKDSEFVWISSVRYSEGVGYEGEKIVKRKGVADEIKGPNYNHVKLIGPATVSDEMHKYLWSKKYTVVPEFQTSFNLWYKNHIWKTGFKAKTLTEAYEKAINWDLDQKENNYECPRRDRLGKGI